MAKRSRVFKYGGERREYDYPATVLARVRRIGDFGEDELQALAHKVRDYLTSGQAAKDHAPWATHEYTVAT